MLSDENSVNFSRPVFELWDEAEVPDYKGIVKNPMDLGTIQARLDSITGYLNETTGLFDPQLFSADVRLVYENAMLYNGDGTEMYEISVRFLDWFKKFMKDMPVSSDSGGGTSTTTTTTTTTTTGASHARKMDDTDTTKRAASSIKSEDAEDNHGDDPDDEDGDDGEDGDDDRESPNGVSRDEMLESLSRLRDERSKAEEELEIIDVDRNAEMPEDERTRLRDEVEALEWERCKHVVKVLQAQVDVAIEASKEPQPEFVDIDLNEVEPRLLRDIQDLIHPPQDKKRTNLVETIERLSAEISSLESKTGTKRASSSSKKRDRTRETPGRERDRRRRRR